MNAQNQIPSDIEAVIEEKRQALIAEAAQKEEAEKREREETEMLGQVKFAEYVKDAMQKAPEFLRPYADPMLAQPDFWRIGKGWQGAEYSEIFFSIPGLALITFEPAKGNWRYQQARWSPSWDEEPRFDWSGYTKDLPYALGKSKEAMAEFEQYQAEYAKQVETGAKLAAERAQDREEQEARQRETEIRSQIQEKAEQAEEQALFDTIKSDPVAVAMLKAFVLIRQERAGFESQIEDANASAYSMENYWSSKASELRRQAQDAERRAEEERSRLQSDLDDAEDKLKKAEHKERYGW